MVYLRTSWQKHIKWSFFTKIECGHDNFYQKSSFSQNDQIENGRSSFQFFFDPGFDLKELSLLVTGQYEQFDKI